MKQRMSAILFARDSSVSLADQPDSVVPELLALEVLCRGRAL
jgi:hypothetical protein